jgi:hypothetical protein
MNRKSFKVCIEKLEELTELGNKLSDLKIETIDCKELYYASEIFLLWVKSEFGEEGEDLVGWWLYEEVEKVIYEADGSETHLNTVDELYDYLVANYR